MYYELSAIQCWKLLPVLGKIVVSYIAIATAASLFGMIAGRKLTEVSERLQRSTVSAFMLASSFVMWHSYKILSGQTYLENPPDMPMVLQRDFVVHLKISSLILFMVASLHVIARALRMLAKRSSSSSAGV
jgi:hypothetical protein